MNDLKFGSTNVNESRLVKHYQDYEAYLKRAKQDFENRWNGPFSENARIQDFNVMRTLGSGAFGRVCAVRHLRDSKLYAMKILDKKHIMRSKQVDHVHSEIRILHAMKFVFLVHMEYYFKNNSYLFLLMPFINGGEMFTHLKKLKKFDETLTKFYGAQVILAMEYIHNIGIVYRDLKPENILVESDGYLKVTDYGFCKKIDDGRTWTLCGTPEYLAPEIIMNQGYNRSVDWWTIGILIYEMAAGFSPFYSKDPMKLYDKIVSGKFAFPAHFSKQIRHLLNNIIQVDRTKRFGVLKNGPKDVKDHDFFKGTDWEAVLLKKVPPYYRPKVSGPEDMTNFEEMEEEPLRVNSKEEFPHEFAEIQVRKHKNRG